jgi:hypothetical protein
MTSRDLIAVKDGKLRLVAGDMRFTPEKDSALTVYKYTPKAKSVPALSFICHWRVTASLYGRKAELERLRNENADLKKGSSSGIRMKVSEKGAVSIYGMGRFPVTLYKEQWLKLLDMSDDIRAFIAANEAQLKIKD